MILYRTPGRSFTRPPRTSTIECSCRLCPTPGMYAVTSIWLVSRTRATLRSAEFGFLGVVVYTRVQTPRFCGLPRRWGAFSFFSTSLRPRRTSWLMVGIRPGRSPKKFPKETGKLRGGFGLGQGAGVAWQPTAPAIIFSRAMSHCAAVRAHLLTCCGLVFAAPVASQSADRTALVRGVVYDSLFSAAPLPGAEVWIEGTNRTARTDSEGHFELSALTGGRYTLTFYHPILDSTGLSARPVIVDVPDGAAAVIVLATPGPTAAHHILCPHDPWRDTGVMLVLVRDAAAGNAIADVTMIAEWSTYIVGEEA